MNSVIQARCESTRPEAGEIKVFTFSVQSSCKKLLSELQPGRHVAIRYPDTYNVFQQRLYSVIGKPAENIFEIAIKKSGGRGVSDHIHETLMEGSTVTLDYVAGDIQLESIGNFDRLGMIAGGIGITLPIALLRGISEKARTGHPVPKTTLVLCVPKVADIPFLHELLELDLTATWFTLRIFLTQDSIQACNRFNPGRPTLDSLCVMGKPQAVVICGSHSFVQSFREHTLSLFPFAKLLIEPFTSPKPQYIQKDRSDDQSIRLYIDNTGEVIKTSSGRSLLEMLESSNISVRSQCKAGICGKCRVRISGGKCRFEPDFCLSEKDRDDGYALACCTFPVSGNISVGLRATTQ